MLELAGEYQTTIRLPIARATDGYLYDRAGSYGLPDQLYDAYLEFMPSLLSEFRPPHPDCFIGGFYDETATQEEFLRILDSLGGGDYELMCHPGYADAELIATSGYAQPRESELAILTDPLIRERVQERGIEIISFGQLDK